MYACEKKAKPSKYKGVSWHAKRGKWYAQLTGKGQIQKYGGYFNDELDAAKRVNQLCAELGIPPQNLGISAIPNQQPQVTMNFILSHGVGEMCKFIFSSFFPIFFS